MRHTLVEPSIWTIDIETAPLLLHGWSLWEQNFGLEQIQTEWSILSYCAKKLGSSKLVYESTGGRGKKKVRDDKRLMQGIWEILDDADFIIAQNGKKFDIPKINTRLVIHGYGPYSPIRVIDTLEIAKKNFGNTSNKLAWMSQHFTDTPKSDHKRFPGFELWKECLEDNPAAWAEMEKYNKRDVVATEKVYMKLRSWMPHHPSLAVFVEDKDSRCPTCNSKDLQRRGKSVSRVAIYHRYQCLSCGAWSRSRSNDMVKEARKALLTA